MDSQVLFISLEKRKTNVGYIDNILRQIYFPW